MDPIRLSALVVLVAALAAMPARAGDMFLQSKKVTAVGLADIEGGNVAAAKDLAVKQAIRKAIEDVIGFFVESSFSAEEKATVKGNQETFSQTVEDRIMTKSAGFVDSHKVLSVKQQGNTMRAVVEVVVKAQSLQSELADLENVLAAAGYPKIVLLVAESYTDAAGKRSWIEKTSGGAVLEKALLEKRLELLAKEKADTLRADVAAFADLVGNDAKAAALAAELGADVAVVGVSDVRYSAFNELNDQMYYLSARVSLRAVRGEGGKVLASFEVEGKGIGVNETQARMKAVQQAAPKAAAQLLSDLIRAWKAEAERGKRYVVAVQAVKNYRKVAKPLMEAIAGLAGVVSVKELQFDAQRLELEVMFQGSSDTLIQRLFEKVGDTKPFDSLDKVGGGEGKVELTL